MPPAVSTVIVSAALRAASSFFRSDGFDTIPAFSLDNYAAVLSSGLTLALYLYTIGFSQFSLGAAAAIGYSLALIAVVVSMFQFGLFRLWGEE